MNSPFTETYSSPISAFQVVPASVVMALGGWSGPEAGVNYVHLLERTYGSWHSRIGLCCVTTTSATATATGNL